MTTVNKYLLCAAVPALSMAAAHWFPWRQTLGRELPRLAAYAIGTAGIVGTSATCIAADTDGDGQRHAALLLTAAGSAGAATALAWLWDHTLDLRRQLVETGAYHDALSYIHPD